MFDRDKNVGKRPFLQFSFMKFMRFKCMRPSGCEAPGQLLSLFVEVANTITSRQLFNIVTAACVLIIAMFTFLPFVLN